MTGPLVQLGDFCQTGSGGTPDRSDPSNFDGGTIPWVKSGELKSRFVEEAEELITKNALNSSAAKMAPKGSLLVAMYGATVGEVSELKIDAATNQAVCHIVPDPSRCERDFLFHALVASKSALLSRRVGGAQPNISQGIIRSLKIPLPPLPEQRRIAAILDKADALRAKRREAIAKLDQLLQSVFLDMFGDPVTNPMGWRTDRLLGDVADICSGITKGRKTNEPTTLIPYLAVSNVQDKRLKLDQIKRIEATTAEIEKYQLRPDDLLLTEGGDPDKLGRGALWGGDIPECIHQNHVFRVRVTSNAIHPVYLNWLVGSERGKRYFLGAAKQTTGIASINMSQLKRFPLLCPPMELQRRFSSVVNQIAKENDRLSNSMTKTGVMFASIQDRAFSCEL